MRTYTRKLLFVTLIFLHSNSHSTDIQLGDLLISEVMANPSLISDTNGEWFEIFNTSANPIDINGITISDDGSNQHLIDNGTSLFVNPGNYFVLGRNGDNTMNGGYIADYVYSSFTLGNTSDQIILSRDNIELARLEYSGLPFGSSGVSAELARQIINPNAEDYQLTQDITYGLGDTGSPGNQGSLTLTSAKPVPLPSALILFASSLLVLVRNCKFRLPNFKTLARQQYLPN